MVRGQEIVVMSDQDGGTAFPIVHPNGAGVQYFGMSLRDYFAAKSINGMLSALDAAGLNYSNPVMMAEHAYAMADAMLAERAK